MRLIEWVEYYAVYFLMWNVARWNDVDAYLYRNRGMDWEAADADNRKYQCERVMQNMRMNRQYGALR